MFSHFSLIDAQAVQSKLLRSFFDDSGRLIEGYDKKALGELLNHAFEQVGVFKRADG